MLLLTFQYNLSDEYMAKVTFQYLERGDDEPRRAHDKIPAGEVHKADGVHVPRVGELVTFSDPDGKSTYKVLAVNSLISVYDPGTWETYVTLGPAEDVPESLTVFSKF
jgi:hypothetical protein